VRGIRAVSAAVKDGKIALVTGRRGIIQTAAATGNSAFLKGAQFGSNLSLKFTSFGKVRLPAVAAARRGIGAGSSASTFSFRSFAEKVSSSIAARGGKDATAKAAAKGLVTTLLATGLSPFYLLKTIGLFIWKSVGSLVSLSVKKFTGRDVLVAGLSLLRSLKQVDRLAHFAWRLTVPLMYELNILSNAVILAYEAVAGQQSILTMRARFAGWVWGFGWLGSGISAILEAAYNFSSQTPVEAIAHALTSPMHAVFIGLFFVLGPVLSSLGRMFANNFIAVGSKSQAAVKGAATAATKVKDISKIRVLGEGFNAGALAAAGIGVPTALLTARLAINAVIGAFRKGIANWRNIGRGAKQGYNKIAKDVAGGVEEIGQEPLLDVLVLQPIAQSLGATLSAELREIVVEFFDVFFQKGGVARANISKNTNNVEQQIANNIGALRNELYSINDVAEDKFGKDSLAHVLNPIKEQLEIADQNLEFGDLVGVQHVLGKVIQNITENKELIPLKSLGGWDNTASAELANISSRNSKNIESSGITDVRISRVFQDFANNNPYVRLELSDAKDWNSTVAQGASKALDAGLISEQDLTKTLNTMFESGSINSNILANELLSRLAGNPAAEDILKSNLGLSDRFITIFRELPQEEQKGVSEEFGQLLRQYSHQAGQKHYESILLSAAALRSETAFLSVAGNFGMSREDAKSLASEIQEISAQKYGNDVVKAIADSLIANAGNFKLSDTKEYFSGIAKLAVLKTGTSGTLSQRYLKDAGINQAVLRAAAQDKAFAERLTNAVMRPENIISAASDGTFGLAVNRAAIASSTDRNLVNALINDRSIIGDTKDAKLITGVINALTEAEWNTFTQVVSPALSGLANQDASFFTAALYNYALNIGITNVKALGAAGKLTVRQAEQLNAYKITGNLTEGAVSAMRVQEGIFKSAGNFYSQVGKAGNEEGGALVNDVIKEIGDAQANIAKFKKDNTVIKKLGSFFRPKNILVTLGLTATPAVAYASIFSLPFGLSFSLPIFATVVGLGAVVLGGVALVNIFGKSDTTAQSVVITPDNVTIQAVPDNDGNLVITATFKPEGENSPVIEGVLLTVNPHAQVKETSVFAGDTLSEGAIAELEENFASFTASAGKLTSSGVLRSNLSSGLGGLVETVKDITLPVEIKVPVSDGTAELTYHVGPDGIKLTAAGAAFRVPTGEITLKQRTETGEVVLRQDAASVVQSVTQIVSQPTVSGATHHEALSSLVRNMYEGTNLGGTKLMSRLIMNTAVEGLQYEGRTYRSSS